MGEAVSPETGADTVDPRRGAALAARWWKWALSAPMERSPVADTTGEFAGWRQPSDVWFLAGTYGGRVVRRCPIAAGKPVFFPVFNTQRIALGLSSAPWRVEASAAEATLNGVPLKVHEFASKRFLATGIPRVAWGLWCALDPLAPGQYVLSIKADAGGFLVDTTYHLDAVEF
ncbi:hypothetical protein ACFVFS_09415 [Kitasatospora sp. NPDC057692]|uniref:hypothetical protein n=1 Tax=Kitasatospora sp. NPDC057692 TaxID=3346215 RepID=UPI00368A5DBB